MQSCVEACKIFIVKDYGIDNQNNLKTSYHNLMVLTKLLLCILCSIQCGLLKRDLVTYCITKLQNKTNVI